MCLMTCIFFAKLGSFRKPTVALKEGIDRAMRKRFLIFLVPQLIIFVRREDEPETKYLDTCS